MLSEISQTGKYCMISYVESKKYSKLVNKTKKKQAHRHRKQTSGYQWGEGREEGQYRGRGLKKSIVMGLYEIVCETFENCKALWN